MIEYVFFKKQSFKKETIQIRLWFQFLQLIPKFKISSAFERNFWILSHLVREAVKLWKKRRNYLMLSNLIFTFKNEFINSFVNKNCEPEKLAETSGIFFVFDSNPSNLWKSKRVFSNFQRLVTTRVVHFETIS